VTRERAHASVAFPPSEARPVLAQSVFHFDLSDWTTWVILGAGLAAAALVVGVVALYGRWRRRRRLADGSREEDLPWDVLMELLQVRSRERAAAGLPPDDDLPPEELLKQLLAGLPSSPRRAPGMSPEEQQYQAAGGAEKRTGRRRWGNPTEVHLTSLLGPDRLHGLVINRSTGGLAIFVDREVSAGTWHQVRSTEAPSYVATVEVEVRYCRKVGRNFLLGCQFCGEIPWNVRVWFG